MFSPHRLAEVAALLSEPPRVAILTALLDGASRPAGELARRAGLSPQSASAHLARLTAGGLLTVFPSGRHRYYRIDRPEVAAAVEALAAAAPGGLPPAAVPSDPERRSLKRLRTCYDHLAGELAVAVARRFVDQDLLRAAGRGYSVTPAGRAWFVRFGVDVESLERGRRAFARACVDWTERQPHVAGALGAALLTRCRGLGWVAPHRGSRALRLTAAGERGWRRWLS